jgi:hypothetical protein
MVAIFFDNGSHIIDNIPTRETNNTGAENERKKREREKTEKK